MGGEKAIHHLSSRSYSANSDADLAGEVIQLWVPVTLYRAELSLAHDTGVIVGTHGVAKPVARTVRQYFWLGVHSYVKQGGKLCDLY